MVKGLEFNKDKAVKVCEAMINAYYNKTHIFHKTDIFPETRPDGMNNADYSQFLFYSNIFNYAVNAKILYKRLNDLDLKLTTKDIVSCNGKIDELVKIARFAKEAKTRIKSASMQIKEKYKGDPLNLLSPDVKETYKNIESITGYGIKLARLLVIWYNKYGFSKYKEEDLEMAVDLHKFRMCLNTGILKAERDEKERYPKDKCIIPITNFFSELCKEKHFSGLALDEAFWAVGAKVCTPAIRRRHDIPCKINCPIEQLCDKDIYVPVKYIPKKHSREAGREKVTRSSSDYVEKVGKLEGEHGVDGKYFTNTGKLNTKQGVLDIF